MEEKIIYIFKEMMENIDVLELGNEWNKMYCNIIVDNKKYNIIELAKACGFKVKGKANVKIMK